MADYGGRGGGDSLRDALNALYPLTGMGEYGAMFPPPTGADQPSAPVPLPPPRPQIPQGLPRAMGMQPGMQPGMPPGMPPGVVPPGVPLPVARPPGLGLPPQQPQQSYTQRLGLGY